MSVQNLMRSTAAEYYDNYAGRQVEIYERQARMRDSYNYGKIDETITRIEGKLKDICSEIKSLTITLENINAK